jgi:hypothetical protein
MKNKKNKTKSNTTNNNENKEEKEGEMKFSQTLLSSKIGSVLTKRPYDLNLSHKTEKIENPFHEILIRDDVLSKKECDSIVASICSIFEYQLATSRGPKFGEARRKNNRMSFADEKLAKMLWEDIGLKTMFIRKSGRRGEHEQQQGDDDDEEEEEEEEEEVFHSLNENFRVYEYTESHHFGPHIDERVRTKNARHQKLVSTHTMLLYLAGEENGLKGGNTYFLDDYRNRIASVTPKAGRVCFFRHGEEKCEHEGEEIFAGKKIVLRSDVFKLVDVEE